MRAAGYGLTLAALMLLSLLALFFYPSFLSLELFADLLSDHASLAVCAIGMSLVILGGGIDLSVGSVAAFASTLAVVLVLDLGLPIPLAALLVLVSGCVAGTIMGLVITRFALPPFIVTLAGMFFFRGLALTLSDHARALPSQSLQALADWEVPLFGAALEFPAVVFLCLLGLAALLLRYSKVGRRIPALGNDEEAAFLLGVPVRRTKLLLYTQCSFCAALAGLLQVVSLQSGDPSAFVGLELEAIAAVVIGGVWLSGGVGGVLAALLGVWILGGIQALLVHDGRLGAGALRVAIAVLLLFFLVMQRLLPVLGRRLARAQRDAPSQ